jgi:hypothetical protein
MIPSDARLQKAFSLFDELNARDPRRDAVEGTEQPRELVYARRMSEVLDRFEPDASEPLRLAVRAQHIARWTIPRSEYPAGREGYKQWRSRLMQYHAGVAGEILRQVGYDADVAERVGKLIRKQGLKRDAEAQTLEDVACLVFLRHYLEEFAREHPEEKVIEILKKTWVKMSDRAQRAALALDVGEQVKRLVARALET